MGDEEIVSELKSFVNQFINIYKQVGRSEDIGTGKERVRRLKIKVKQFLEQHISSVEAKEYVTKLDKPINLLIRDPFGNFYVRQIEPSIQFLNVLIEAVENNEFQRETDILSQINKNDIFNHMTNEYKDNGKNEFRHSELADYYSKTTEQINKLMRNLKLEGKVTIDWYGDQSDGLSRIVFHEAIMEESNSTEGINPYGVSIYGDGNVVNLSEGDIKIIKSFNSIDNSIKTINKIIDEKCKKGDLSSNEKKELKKDIAELKKYLLQKEINKQAFTILISKICRYKWIRKSILYFIGNALGVVFETND